MTGDWATIAYHSRTEESSVSFHIKAATISASGKVWGSWSDDSDHASYSKRHGPTRQNPFSDNEEPQDEALDQCIFIDSFRIADLAWYKRIRLAITQKSGSTMFPSPSNTGGGASQTFPSQGSSSRQVIMGSGAGSYETVRMFHEWNSWRRLI